MDENQRKKRKNRKEAEAKMNKNEGIWQVYERTEMCRGQTDRRLSNDNCISLFILSLAVHIETDN